MIQKDGSLRCCHPKFNNCPVVRATTMGFVIEGDDGQTIEFSRDQFEVLVKEGALFLEAE